MIQSCDLSENPQNRYLDIIFRLQLITIDKRFDLVGLGCHFTSYDGCIVVSTWYLQNSYDLIILFDSQNGMFPCFSG